MTKKEIASLDRLWSEYVKEKGGYKCEYCKSKGKKIGGTSWLEAAHIIGRTYRATRWRLDNGMCLCSGCHRSYDEHRPEEKNIREEVVGDDKYALLCQSKQVIAKNQDYKEIKNQLIVDYGEAMAVALFTTEENINEKSIRDVRSPCSGERKLKRTRKLC